MVSIYAMVRSISYSKKLQKNKDMKIKKRYTIPSLSIITMEMEGLIATSTSDNFDDASIDVIGVVGDPSEQIDPEDAL